jgi:uncharacterized protein (DUF302 family)
MMYGFITTLKDVPFAVALAKTVDALKAEGFGVLSDIDIQRAMKEVQAVSVSSGVRPAHSLPRRRAGLTPA